MEKFGRVNDPKLIGYGLYSLVFRPPLLFLDHQVFRNIDSDIQTNPDRFVGLITTRKHYDKKMHHTTALLRELSSRHKEFSLIVMPDHLLSREPLPLSSDSVRELLEKYPAVRKRIEYEQIWDPNELVEMIYPYAGKPLAQVCKNRAPALHWENFFHYMVEVADFLSRLHADNFVHGDLSPNNLLYEEPAGFRIVDWNMLCRSEDFLLQRKGRNRVGCWSPEHFSLTTTRLLETPVEMHWTIYSEEMQKYIDRLLLFTLGAHFDERKQTFREEFGRLTAEGGMFRSMFEDLQNIARSSPALIGKYHDLRYFMDTIVKCVAAQFPEKTESQQHSYNAFVALCLAQNLPERKAYLENPDLLDDRIKLILDACASNSEVAPGITAEQSLMQLLG